ncbi:K+-transporting ATPase ATPase C chain [Nocardioides sp. YR527]|uniref:potassium-transporting ATPase subunit KdpC n=1 Tax=Nocardioides sp. YR527 TaxID=1881028 RepID=UPI00087F64DF|nr:potassium-transporting ATPase subunit KdpC [Nocardioides sp. YR527]SDL03503.1 K+-transporting ATPase ATPase C chain [Nocardioides sp. YR527]
MNDIYALLRHSWAGLRVLIAATLVLGLGYPLLVTGIAQVAFPWQANGSLVTADGSHTTDPSEAAGSALIGQVNDDSALFYPRPSAAGDGYDTLSSYGSNLGPEEPALIDAIKERKAEVAAREGVAAADVPADAVTASGSGLDPHISPDYASLQVARVAKANGLTEAKVRELVADSTEGRTWGVLGDAHVNVLLLNIAVKQAAH